MGRGGGATAASPPSERCRARAAPWHAASGAVSKFSGAKDACVHKRVANAAKRLFCILFAHATVQPMPCFLLSIMPMCVPLPAIWQLYTMPCVCTLPTAPRHERATKHLEIPASQLSSAKMLTRLKHWTGISCHIQLKRTVSGGKHSAPLSGGGGGMGVIRLGSGSPGSHCRTSRDFQAARCRSYNSGKEGFAF